MQQEVKNLLREATIDVDDALRRFNNNENLYKKCLGLFPQESTYDKLLEAFSMGNLENVRKEAHTMKGISSNLGIEKLTGVCTKVLAECKNGTGVLDIETIEEFKRTYKEVNEIIEESIMLLKSME